MWAWVSADRERVFAGAAGWLLLAQVGLGVLVIVASVVLAIVAGPWWLALALLPGVGALPWRGLASLVVVLTYPLAAFGPLLAVHFLALVPFRIVEAIVEVFTGGDPASVVQPTVVRPSADS